MGPGTSQTCQGAPFRCARVTSEGSTLVLCPGDSLRGKEELDGERTREKLKMFVEHPCVLDNFLFIFCFCFFPFMTTIPVVLGSIRTACAKQQKTRLKLA